MFDSLDDEMRRDEDAVSSMRERWLRYGGVLLLSLVIFGGLFAAIWFFE
jgi:hypothetical protein